MCRHARGLAMVVACGVLLHAGVAAAAEVSGKVRSRDGARLPYAGVIVRSVSTGAEWRSVSSDLGAFRVSDLPAGSYEVRAEAEGFRTAVTPGVLLDAGETADLELTLELDTVRESVTVLGTAPRDGVESAALREMGARDVGEALTATAGVSQLRKGAIANEIVIRGLQSRDLNVLVDGQRVDGACPNHMDPPAFHVDFAEVDRIEVGKGPFDVRHFGSLGGVVNVVTKRPGAGWQGSAALGLGAGAYANPSAVLSYGARTWSALAGGSYRRGDPYEDGHGRPMTSVANYTTQALDQRAFGIASGWTRVVGAPSGSTLVQASYTRQQAGAVLYPYLQMDAVSDDTDRAALTLGHTGGRWLQSVQGRATFARVRHDMTDARRTSAGTATRGYSMGTDATTEAWGGRADAVLREVTAGVEVTRRRWDARTELAMRSYAPQASVPGVEIRSAGIFADWRHPVDAHLTLEAGGRLDVVGSRADASTANTALYLAYHGTRSTSRNDVLPSGRARLAWQTGAWQLGAGVGHAARVAEGNERFFALQRMGTDWVGNPTLGPSRHTGLEARVGWTRRGAAVDAQVFTGWIDGYVAVYDQARLRPQPGIMNAWARTYTNTDAQLTGAEVNGSAPLGHGLFLSGDVSHVRGSHAAVPIRGIAASPLAEMPALRARARLRFDDGRWFGGVEEVVTADQRRVDASLGEAPTPGAAITHLSGGRRWRAVTVTAGVTNLFDRFYVDALSYLRDPFRSGARLPEPGRQWFATLTWRP